MGRIPKELRDTIGRNIRACRLKKFPGRGGGMRCAEAFGVTPQQWSPWESGKRTPDEIRLQKIADFFEVTVEFLRQDQRKPKLPPPLPPPRSGRDEPPGMSFGEWDASKTFVRVPGIDVPPPPGWQPDEPGSPASFFWLARHFVTLLQVHGLRIDRQCLEYLAEQLKTLRS